MEKLTPTKKKKLLSKMIELMVHMGYEIEPYMGMPLNKFNYENVQKQIEKLQKDLDYVHSDN
jgi:hypothetical protein